MRPDSLQLAVFLLFASALVPVAVPAAAAQTPAEDSIASFSEAADRAITSAFDAMEIVPGMAVAVVRGDRTIYTRGFGEADLEAGIPATAETEFYIASTTKSFTALAIALLDARGELDMDASLASYFPEVEFDPALKADSIRLRDLLTHTSGLENFGIAYRVAFTGEHTPEGLVDVLTLSEPNDDSPLGEFQYTNTGYNIASMIMDRETGRPWQDQLRDLVFEPAGMHRTTAYASLPRREGWPIAAPYTAFGVDGISRIYLEKQDNTMQAAGGLYSTASDLARWVTIQLNDGRVGDRQVFPAELIQESQRMHAETSGSFGPFGRDGYGLGWYGGMLGEEKLLHHFGGFAGFHAHSSYMPEHDIGVVVVVNESGAGTRLAGLTATFVYDWWLGLPDIEAVYATRTEELVGQRDQRREQVEQGRASRAERIWQLTEPLEVYTGTYVSRQLGTAVVTIVDETLAVRLGNTYAVSTPFTAENTIRVELIPGRGQVFGFEVDETGEVTGASLNGVPFDRVGA